MITIPWFWFILTILCSILPVIFIKQYIITNNIQWLIYSNILCILLSFCYIKLFSSSDFFIIFTLCKILTIILVAVISIFVFNVKITMSFWLGILLFIIASFLIDV